MKKKALIVDLDGTLSDHSGRIHYISNGNLDLKSYHHECENDPPHWWCLVMIHAMRQNGYYPIIISGRPEEYKEQTELWLMTKCGLGPGDFDLYLAHQGDTKEQCSEFKKRIYQDVVSPAYNVLFVIEDWDPMVAMWRSIGVQCLQCNPTLKDS